MSPVFIGAPPILMAPLRQPNKALRVSADEATTFRLSMAMSRPNRQSLPERTDVGLDHSSANVLEYTEPRDTFATPGAEAKIIPR